MLWHVTQTSAEA